MKHKGTSLMEHWKKVQVLARALARSTGSQPRLNPHWTPVRHSIEWIVTPTDCKRYDQVTKSPA
jgi:hypothetical protein